MSRAVSATAPTPRRRGTRGRTRNPVLQNDLNASSQKLRYHAILAEMFEYLHGRRYPSDKTFTIEERGALTPRDIYRWMCYRTFGKEDPSQDDTPKIRSSTIQYWKKAISCFMPTHGAWNEQHNTGNPTRAKLINGLHKAVKKHETRGTGQKPKADRSFTPSEFDQVLDLFDAYGPLNSIQSKRFLACIKFQYHMVARADDTSHMKKANIQPSQQFPGHLTAQVRWSKNVQEERDCPKQLLMGSMNAKYCVLLGLVLYLEKWIGDGEGASSQWLFANGITTAQDEVELQEKEADACKAAYGRYMTKAVVKNDAFTKQAPGQVGTHSVKKIATTTCRQRGARTDDTDYRARWKIKKIQDRYTDTQLYWPDIKAGSKLCEGGVCQYRVKEGLGVTDLWLATEICPNITGAFDSTVGAILAKPLIWACYDQATKDKVPIDLYMSVTQKINRLDLEDDGLEDGENPIKKYELIPSLNDSRVDLDEIPEGDTDIDLGRISARSSDWRIGMYAKVRTIAERVTEIQHHDVAKLAAIEKRLKTIESIVRAVAVAPARVITGSGSSAVTRRGVAIRQGSAESSRTYVGPASLVRCPRSLEILWDEYQNGVGGNKPARDFTARERGRVKVTYFKRKNFWKCMERLLEGGCTVNVAIRRIHRVYGYGSITSILAGLARDEGGVRTGHARLQS